MGRPKENRETNSTYFDLRCHMRPSVRRAIDLAADLEDRSRSGVLRLFISEGLARRGLLPSSEGERA